MATQEDVKRAEEQARCQLESIKEMVAALQCDYERLEELRDEREALVNACEEDDEDDSNVAGKKEELAFWDDENGEELAQLKEDAGECESEDDARERILEDPLSVEVRSDWYTPGSEDSEPAEYCILLCTGGPAARIIGELSSGEPSSARLEYQDWFTPWTELITRNADHESLLTYARCFCFDC